MSPSPRSLPGPTSAPSPHFSSIDHELAQTSQVSQSALSSEIRACTLCANDSILNPAVEVAVLGELGIPSRLPLLL